MASGRKGVNYLKIDIKLLGIFQKIEKSEFWIKFPCNDHKLVAKIHFLKPNSDNVYDVRAINLC